MMINKNFFSEEELKLPILPESQKKLFQKVQSQSFEFYLYDEIEDPMDYIDLLQVLDNAGPNDTVIIHINSVGGRLDIALQIRNSIVNSEATVIASLDGSCYSAATIIALSCKSINVTPSCLFMIHTYSHLLYGKENETKSQKEASDRLWQKVVDEVYSGFLTDEEISSVRAGTDIWLTSDEMVPRLTALKEKNEQRENEYIENATSMMDDESLDATIDALSAQLEILKKEKKKRIKPVEKKQKKKAND